MNRETTKTIQDNPTKYLGQEVQICGWVKTFRHQKEFSFVEVNDGSQVSNLQIFLESSFPQYAEIIEQIQTGAALIVTGQISQSLGKEQAIELHPTSIEIVGPSPEDFLLQKKRHSFEFLRTIAHLRPRTNTMGAVTRVRNRLAFATHQFFQQKGFQYVHTPILTSLDCEGAGELFEVDKANERFFGRQAYLTVSGQLNVEAFACALSRVYTFGPTFRAENSNTSRHLAEFWMIEPEIAFADLDDNMELATDFLQFLIKDVLRHCHEDLTFFNRFIDTSLIKRLDLLTKTSCVRISYTEAIRILQSSGQSFTFPCQWGADLQSEHERFLAEKHVQGPVIVYDYPKEIKAFYMRLNGDGKTVAAMDLLVPGVGELIGGSQREERLEILEKRIVEAGLDKEDYAWYLDLRKYGTVPHAGFGMGFERLVQHVTGMENIRDVIPYPRSPGSCSY